MNKKYDWQEIKIFYESGKTLNDCIERFGFARQSWSDAVKRGDIVPRKQNKPLHELKSRKNLKRQIIKQSLIPYVCAICGNNGYHNNKPLVLQLDHIDGNKYNNDLPNLQFLCPNCHSQTDTFTSKLGKNRYTVH